MRYLSLFFLAITSLPATIVGGANGATLAGGTIQAFWADATNQTFVIGASGASGVINQAAAFNFSVNNDTQGNVWTLTNNRASNLTSFVINLSAAVNGGVTAIFDDGRIPFGDINRAAGSGTGVTGGVTSLTTFVFNFSSQYTGDGGTNMYRMLNVTSVNGGNGFSSTSPFIFSTDSDILTPEPATWMMALGFCALGLIRRQRS